MRSRRQFLQQTALLAAIERAFAINPPKGSTYLDAEHIVVLMQENRSFDHSLGALRGVRGFNDPRAVTLPGNKPVWLQTNAKGETFAPFRLNIKESRITWLGSLPHSWTDQIDARNHGNHDKWLDAKASGRKECAGMPLTLGYYNREDLPFYYALADAFTVCDQNFCSSLTGTTPNRLHLWTGTTRDNTQPGKPAKVRNSDVTYTATANWTTFPERLEEAGVSWRVYQNELSLPTGFNSLEDDWLSNFTDNPLEWFDQYHVGHHDKYLQELEKLEATLPGEIAELEKGPPSRDLVRKKAMRQFVAKERKKWTPEAKARMTPRENALHAKAFTTNQGDPNYRALSPLRYQDGDQQREMLAPKGDPLHQFRADVSSGKLPTISWLVPSSHFSDHPGSPWYGAWYLAEVMNILTKNPEVWKKTIFVLTYDENDGYFDHVPPFVAPDPSQPETGKVSPGIDAAAEFVPLADDAKTNPPRQARGGPIGLGYRVPMIVASPWSRGGFVCSQVFDHTSVLQLMESVIQKRTGRTVRETNISAWRRAICGDMRSIFRPYASAPNPDLTYPEKNQVLQTVHKAQFKDLPSGWHLCSPEDAANWKTATWRPRQEPGTRPALPLPYELFADASLSQDRKSLTLQLAAGKQSGAPFHAYAPQGFRADPKLRTRAYALEAGTTLTDTWATDGFADGKYQVALHGPNGFFREFAGDISADPQLSLQGRYANGNFELHCDSQTPLRLQITDASYGTGTRTVQLATNSPKRIRLPLAKSNHWYDFTITVEGQPAYRRRYAGHVETGQPSTSDPAMAGQLS